MLVGKKVILDVIEPEDLEWLRNQRNDPKLRQYFRAWKDISKDQQLAWYQERGNNSHPNHVYFKICIKKATMVEPSGLVGCCGLHYVDWRLRSGEFGIFLDHDSRSKGYGKEALFMLCDFGFREMALHKIWCEVYSNNSAIHLYRKLGFKNDGILRDNYFCDGKYGNSTVMSVLEDEWFSLHGGR